jgi:hypothetical protein
MNIFEKDPADYLASKDAEHDSRPLCAHCNMFGSIEDVPGAAGGMIKVGDDWYHRRGCFEEAKKIKEMKKKSSATVTQFPLRKETLPTTEEAEEERQAA